MIHYTFKLTYELPDFHSNGEPNPYVIVRVNEYTTLYNLAGDLLNTIGFELDHAFGFHSDLKNPYAKNMKREYTLFADDGEGRMASDTGVENTSIHTVFKEGDKMLFHFDYGDDWHFIVECIAIEQSKSRKRKPETLEITGEFPEQYPDCEEDDFEETQIGINLMTGERIEIKRQS